MKKVFIYLVLVLFLFSFLPSVMAREINERTEIDFFWRQGCSACAQMKPFLESMEQKYSVIINSYETSSNQNVELFYARLDSYNVSQDRRGFVPTVFIKDSYFVGYSTEIVESIEKILQGEEIENGDSLIGETVKTRILGLWDVEFSTTGKSLLVVGLILALLDSLNVCSITVLIFLVVYTLSVGSVKRAFKIGLVFTLVIYVFYALFMLFLTSAFSALANQYSFQIRILVITISLIAGLLLVKDFFFYGKWVSLRVPESAKPLLEKYIKQATIGSTIILGVLASLVELPCTAIFPLIYTALLGSAGVAGLERVYYILFYNLVYVWPLLFIVFGTYFSWSKVEDIDSKVQKFKGWMKLIAGIALLLIAAYFVWPLILS